MAAYLAEVSTTKAGRRRAEHAARSLDETGWLVGGWRKADEAAKG